jgi:hypothetical protein
MTNEFEAINRANYIAAVTKAANECPDDHQFHVSTNRYKDGFETFDIYYQTNQEVLWYYNSGGCCGYFAPSEAQELIDRA